MYNINKTIKNLKTNNMGAYYVKDKEELFQLLNELLPLGTSVGWGDSVTLEELAVFEYIRSKDYIVYDKHKKGLNSEQKREIYINNFLVDTFLTGTNAITENGELYNIDGNGSRVAPMLYGPKQVIVIVGYNKIVPDLDAAVNRTRQIAAPLDAKRLNKDTPCTKLDKCIDCKHHDRICNDFVTIRRQFIKERIKVIIVDQELGY